MKTPKIIDITMWMGDWTYPGDKPFSIQGPYSAIGEEKEFCYEFSTNSVEGTHIQAPHYILKNGKSINEFPLSYFRRRAIIIDIAYPSTLIPSSIIESTMKDITNQDAVIFRTGVMDRLIDGENVKDPLLSLEDAQLLKKSGIKMIVTDTTCLDNPLSNNGDCPTTKFCCQNDIVLVKQVCNLKEISQKSVVVEAYPLKIKEISGTPCRAVVIEEI